MIEISREIFEKRAKKLGKGTQGTAYLIPSKNKSGKIVDQVVKIYRRKALENDDLQIKTHLERLIRARKSMSPDNLKIIAHTTTYINRLVSIDGSFKGYTMMAIPEKFLPEKEDKFTKKIKKVERSLDLAYQDDETRKNNCEPIVSPYGRKVILAQLLRTISILHANDIIIGDISPNNVLVYVDPVDQRKNAIMLLDTDSFRTKNSMFPLNQPHTPGWIPPENRNQTTNQKKYYQDEKTDVWKVALLILRLYYFGEQRTMIESSQEALNLISKEVSKEFAKLVSAGLSENPQNRPSAKVMLDILCRKQN